MTREIQLTRGYVAVIDDEDYEAVSQFKWSASVIRPDLVYARTSARVDGRVKWMFLHRFITSAAAGIDVDHRDGDGLNNRRGNLRPCTHAKNIGNQKRAAPPLSGFRGVYWDPHRSTNGRPCTNPKAPWKAQIVVEGKAFFLGRYATPGEASQIYESAAKRLRGEFDVTNREVRA